DEFMVFWLFSCAQIQLFLSDLYRTCTSENFLVSSWLKEHLRMTEMYGFMMQ
uniref:Uncharacterized protein n=1 Tax=Triticum urartu TaxID=4572 RepID=A0A8R7PWI0_TRIUA